MEQSQLIKIDNDMLAALPAGQFEGQIIVVEETDAVADACAFLAAAGVIGFDTETRPSFTAGVTNRVALLQLSAGGRCYLFRLCRMPLERPLLRLLASPQVIKVGADVRNDIRGLQALRHFRAAGFFDLQSVIRNHGIDELGLRKMAAAVLGIRISKAQRLSNWEAVTLTAAQQTYAATDAWIALEIYKKLGL